MWPYNERKQKSPTDTSAFDIDVAFCDFVASKDAPHEADPLTPAEARELFAKLDDALKTYNTKPPNQWVLHPRVVSFLHERAKQIIFLMIGRVHALSMFINSTDIVLALGSGAAQAQIIISLRPEELNSILDGMLAVARMIPSQPDHRETCFYLTCPPTMARPGSGIWYSMVALLDCYTQYASSVRNIQP